MSIEDARRKASIISSDNEGWHAFLIYNNHVQMWKYTGEDFVLEVDTESPKFRDRVKQLVDRGY